MGTVPLSGVDSRGLTPLRSPRRWIRTPCWSDQTSGGAVGALGEPEHRAGGRGALEGGGLPVGGAGHVAGGVDVGPARPLRGPHADGDQEHVGLDDACRRRVRRASSPWVAISRRPRRRVTPASSCRRWRWSPPPGPIRVSKGRRRRVDQRGGDAAGAGGGGDLLADQAGADDRDVGGAGERRVEAQRVVERPQRVRVLEAGELDRAGARGDQRRGRTGAPRRCRVRRGRRRPSPSCRSAARCRGRDASVAGRSARSGRSPARIAFESGGRS